MTTQRFNAELRASMDGNKLTGHAAVFGQLANLPGHYEQLARSAFDDALSNPDTDVVALFNHDPSQVLGRQSAGTLRLSTDDEGLRFEVDLGDTSYAQDLRKLLVRKEITGASFGFIPGEDEWSRAQDGRQLRTHTKVLRLLDVSPVTFPAYEGASVALRHMTFAPSRRRSQIIRARARVLLGENK